MDTKLFTRTLGYLGGVLFPCIALLLALPSQAQTITTFAGTGVLGYSGDGGAATAAKLNGPAGIATDASGNTYIADQQNHCIRKISSSGVIATIAGTGTSGYTGDGGAATAARLNKPVAVAVDGSGNIYISDQNNDCVRKVNTSGIISTFAGTGGGGYNGDGIASTAAAVYNPRGIVVDASGNVYIADFGNNRIRKVNTSGTISTFAGNGSGSYSGDGAAATAAGISGPHGLAIDASGNIYVSQEGNARIRKVNTSGNISTVAGTGTAGFSGDGGAATAAQINNPAGMVVDASGNLFFADQYNSRIRKVNTSGNISSVAGIGSNGFTGDCGAATSAKLNDATGVAIDGAGNVLIADNGNHRIRKIDPSTVYTNYIAGITGSSSVCAGASTALADSSAGGTWSSTNTSVATISSAGVVYGVSAGSTTISYSLTGSCGTAAVTKVVTVNPLPAAGTISGASSVCAGSATTFASSGDAGGTWSSSATSVATVNAAGVVFGAAAGSATITYTVTTSCGTSVAIKTITVNPLPFAGTVSGASSVCMGNATTFSHSGDAGGAWSSSGTSVATVTATGAVYGAGAGSATITYTVTNTCGSATATKAITVNTLPVAGTISGPLAVETGDAVVFGSTVAGGAWSTSNSSIATINGDGVLFGVSSGPVTVSYSVSGSCGSTVVTFATTISDPAGPGCPSLISTIAGTGSYSYVGDGGAATSASLSSPYGIAMDGSGNIYIADGGNGRIRKISPAGVITTVAGNGDWGFSGDGGPATAASMKSPNGIAVDASGNLYIADCFNNRIRKVSTSGIISTIAGTGDYSYSGDGGAATSAVLKNPYALTTDAGGNVYIADWGNHRIRKVSTSGIITTVAGNGVSSYSGDGGAATAAAISYPQDIVVDASGNMYISEKYDNVIRKVSTAGIITTIAGTGEEGYSGDGGPATAATLDQTFGIALDGAGNLYICDESNHRIRKVSTSGIISTVAGNGTGGFSGDDAAPTAAKLYYPRDVMVDAAGILFIADYGNNRIRKIYEGVIVSDISGTATVCAGSSVTMSNSDAGGVWSSSNTSIATVDGTGVVSGVSAGVATISYSVSNSCGSASVTRSITVNALPSAGTLSGASSVCAGSSTSLSGSGDAGGSWSSSVVSIATVSSAGVVYGVASGSATITYSVTTSCGTNTATKDITVNPLPLTAALSGASEVCEGSGITLTSDIPGGTWSSSDVSVASVTTAGQVIGVSAGSVAISYSVSNSCGTATTTKSVVINPLPAVISGSSSVCAGSATTLNNAIVGGMWSASNTRVTVDGVSGTVTGVTVGSVTITYTTGCGSRTFPMTVNATPASITGSSSVCEGGSVSLANTVTGGSWISSNTAVASVSSTGTVSAASVGTAVITYMAGGCYTTKALTVNAAPAPLAAIPAMCEGSELSLSNPVAGGSWSVTVPSYASISSGGVLRALEASTISVRYTVGGCVVSTPLTINATPGIIDGSSSVCAGSSALLSVPSSGGVWISSNTAVASVSSTGTVSATSVGTTVITYMAGGCYSAKAVSVNAAPAPLAAIPAMCIGDVVTLSNPVDGGSWSVTVPSYASISSSGVLRALEASTISVRYTLGGCVVSTPLTINATPGTISGSSSVCTGNSALLSVPSSGGVWSSSNTAVASVSSTGTVSGAGVGTAVITYMAGGCYSTKAVSVNAAPAPLAAIPAMCIGDVVTLSNPVAGGSWSVTVPSYASISGGVLRALESSTISVRYTLGGCVVSTPLTINVTPRAIVGGSSMCNGSSLTLSNTIAGGIWNSSNTAVASVMGSGSSTGIQGMSAGLATITYSIGNCSVTKAITVNNCGAKEEGSGTDIATSVPDIRIFPNPSTGVVNIASSVPVIAHVYAADGKLVMQQQDATQLDMSAMASGMYMIVLYDTNHQKLKAERLMKE